MQTGWSVSEENTFRKIFELSLNMFLRKNNFRKVFELYVGMFLRKILAEKYLNYLSVCFSEKYLNYLLLCFSEKQFQKSIWTICWYVYQINIFRKVIELSVGVSQQNNFRKVIERTKTHTHTHTHKHTHTFTLPFIKLKSSGLISVLYVFKVKNSTYTGNNQESTVVWDTVLGAQWDLFWKGRAVSFRDPPDEIKWDEWLCV